MAEDDVEFGEDDPETEQEEEGKPVEEVREWAESNFQAVKNKIESLQTEMRNSKPEEGISVRKVEVDGEEKIVVEYSVERWFSPEYFRKMLEGDEDGSDGDMF